jgi:hypothetical protein
MGGTVAVTIRDPSGKIHKMGRWTNPLPRFVNSFKFITCDEKHLKDYLDVWYQMRQDWKTYGDSADNPSPMSSCYARDANMMCAPQEYGIVVIDYVDHVLITNQGYAPFGRSDLFKIFLRGDREYCEDVVHLIQSGRVTKATRENMKFVQSDCTSKISDIKTVKNLADALKGIMCIRLDLDMDPWVIIDFNEDSSPDGLRATKKEIEKHISLNKKDEAGWARAIEEAHL